MPPDVIAEIWAAIRTEVTRFGDSCFVANLAIPELKRHGADLLPAIEHIIGAPDFEKARKSSR